jgi:putative toxin-antitoxin system antitoxin component (TIGR02293 family)
MEAATQDRTNPDSNEFGESIFAQVLSLLGGRTVFKQRITSKLDAHKAIVKGLPSGALAHLVSQVTILDTNDLVQAVGVSRRTIQRRAETPRKLLSPDQSGRAWKFAEVLMMAKDVFGSQEEAERWLATRAIALDQQRPVDLLTSPAGTELVEQLLGRLKYAVYT